MSVHRNKTDTAAAISMVIANNAAKIVISIIVGSLKMSAQHFVPPNYCLLMFI